MIKRALRIFVAVMLIVMFASVAVADDTVAFNKSMHFGFSFLFGGVANAIEWENMPYIGDKDVLRITSSTFIGMLPGILKEESDRRVGHESFSSRSRDILIDGIGSLCGALYVDYDSRTTIHFSDKYLAFTYRW